MQDFVRMLYPNATESNVRQLMSMASDHKAAYKVVMTPERIREMKATFKECDTDGSGDVSRSEFIEGIQNAGASVGCILQFCVFCMQPLQYIEGSQRTFIRSHLKGGLASLVLIAAMNAESQAGCVLPVQTIYIFDLAILLFLTARHLLWASILL